MPETETLGLTAQVVLGLINGSAPAVSPLGVNRLLNSAFQVSTTRDALVAYFIKITTVATIGGNADGDVFLEIADDAAFTQNVQQLAVFGQSQAFGVVIGIQCTQAITGSIIGAIPAGKWVRMRTVLNLGTPTFQYRLGQETLL